MLRTTLCAIYQYSALTKTAISRDYPYAHNAHSNACKQQERIISVQTKHRTSRQITYVPEYTQVTPLPHSTLCSTLTFLPSPNTAVVLGVT